VKAGKHFPCQMVAVLMIMMDNRQRSIFHPSASLAKRFRWRLTLKSIVTWSGEVYLSLEVVEGVWMFVAIDLV